jgi:hypothetical protein
MDFNHCARHFVIWLLFLIGTSTLLFTNAFSQNKSVEGKEFSPYKASDFKPKKGLFYLLYISPVYTVDPLGIGGKSTYALSLGARFNIWESRSSELRGLKIKGWYVGGGYEYYPQQFDLIYLSAWMRVKTFLPLVGKIDYIYADDGEHRGRMTRYCLGVEVRKISIMLSGTVFGPINGEAQPIYYSDYTNSGCIIVIIPVYTRD